MNDHQRAIRRTAAYQRADLRVACADLLVAFADALPAAVPSREALLRKAGGRRDRAIRARAELLTVATRRQPPAGVS